MVVSKMAYECSFNSKSCGRALVYIASGDTGGYIAVELWSMSNQTAVACRLIMICCARPCEL
eukprot:scaffold111692_cov39-Prasinocladus_malaysianus.AAC.1